MIDVERTVLFAWARRNQKKKDEEIITRIATCSNITEEEVKKILDSHKET